jgi:hypothetical protein
LEVSVLSEVPVPELGTVDARTLSRIIDMVDEVSRRPDPEIDTELDNIVCELYGFSPTERRELFGLR